MTIFAFRLSGMHLCLIIQATQWIVSLANNKDLTPQEKLLNKFFGPNRRMAEVIPKANLLDNEPIKVYFNFIVNHVYSIRSNEQEVDVSLWIVLRWVNQLVSWNITQYPVKYLDLSIDKIWMPKIMLVQNTLMSSLHPSKFGAKVTVHPDGFTSVDFGAKVNVQCKMSSCLFPLDSHKCDLTFFAFTQDSNDVRLIPLHKIRDDYDSYTVKETSLWHISLGNITASTTKNILTRGDSLSSILFASFNLSRKSDYFLITIVIPLTLTLSLAFLAPLFPLETGERTSILLTCFLASIVYLDAVFKSIPKSSDYIPLLVGFLLISLSFTAFQFAMTALIAYFGRKSSKSRSLIASCLRAVRKRFGSCGKNRRRVSNSEPLSNEKSRNLDRNDFKMMDNECEIKAGVKDANAIFGNRTTPLRIMEGDLQDIKMIKSNLSDKRLFERNGSSTARLNSESDADRDGQEESIKRNIAQKILEGFLNFISIILLLVLVIIAILIFNGKMTFQCSSV